MSNLFSKSNPVTSPASSKFGSYTPFKSKYGSSGFWMGDFDRSYGRGASVGKDIYKLASVKRAIGNFVTIVTGQNIPVRYASKGDSFTDGKTVTLSADVEKPESFDPAVGLALHEASHIVLSNFKLLSNLEAECQSILTGARYNTLDRKFKAKNVSFLKTVKNILNWVEDRRIDSYMYDNAPGYQMYYKSLYDKYFNSPEIEAALKSDSILCDETIGSYMARLINLHSRSTRLDALVKLREISNVVDLPKINRLKSSKEALEIALKIARIIIDAVEKNEQEDDDDEEGEGEGDGEGGDGEADFDETTDFSNAKVSSKPSKGGKKIDPSKLTDAQKQQLKEALEKQEKFLDGDIDKTALDDSEAAAVSQIEKSGTELQSVAQKYEGLYKGYDSVDVIVVNKMTRELMESPSFPLCENSYGTLREQCEKSVNDGIRIGTLLGKKLQTRSESRETVFNRQLTGKIDKRMVSALGYGNDHVFFTKEVDMYKKANLHISVDASGSMRGSKWDKTMVNIVALAKAVDVIPNIEIQISFRTTTERGEEKPYVIVAYDSRVDKFIKVKQLFKYLRPDNTTPEGLCFEAISKKLLDSDGAVDSYFLNLSDGEPYFSSNKISYSGNSAARHTKVQVDNMISRGINVLSYFISESSADAAALKGSSAGRIFIQSYGRSASFINVTNISDITKTMNNLLMKKPNKD